MPTAIVPVHTLDNHSSLFDAPSVGDMDGLSALQQQLLGGGDVLLKTAKVKTDPRTIGMLEAISACEDEVLTVASSLSRNQRGEPIFRVPAAITDHELLSMKAAGYLVGSGRSVTMTDRARIALRDKWLGDTNKLRQERKKAEFVHPRRLSSAEGEARTASAQAAGEATDVKTAPKFRRLTDK